MEECTKAQSAIGKEPISVPEYDAAMATSHRVDAKIIKEPVKGSVKRSEAMAYHNQAYKSHAWMNTRQARPACTWPIIGLGSQTSYPMMHAARQASPECNGRIPCI